jgi:hypothetical protein
LPCVRPIWCPYTCIPLVLIIFYVLKEGKIKATAMSVAQLNGFRLVIPVPRGNIPEKPMASSIFARRALVIKPFSVQLTKHNTSYHWNSHVGPMGNKQSQPNLYLSSPIFLPVSGPRKSSSIGLNPHTSRDVSRLAATTTVHIAHDRLSNRSHETKQGKVTVGFMHFILRPHSFCDH